MRVLRFFLLTVLVAWIVACPVVGHAQPPAALRATLFTRTIEWTTAPGTVVRFVLTDGTRTKATTTATADGQGGVRAVFPRRGQAVSILAGDQIGVHPTAGTAYTRTVPALSVALETATRNVVGTAPASGQVICTVYDANDTEVHSEMADVGNDGRYVLNLPQQVELATGMWGTAQLALLGGDAFVARWDVLSAQLTIGSPSMSGRATLGDELSAELGDGAAEKASTGRAPTIVTDSPNYDLTFRQGYQTVPVMAGDLFTLTVGGEAGLYGQVPTITARIDAVTDAVTGIAPADSEIVVTATATGDPDVSVATHSDASGNYNASFAGQVDLVAGSMVYAQYSEGFITYRAVGVQEQVRATLYGSQVEGSAPQGARVEVQLFEAAPTGSSLLAEGTTTAGANGAFRLDLTKPGSRETVSTRPGNQLAVSMGDSSGIELVLPALSAEADPAADTVTGTVPPDAPVAVIFGGMGPGGQRLETTADASGRYSVSFAGEADIVPGSTGSIVVEMSGGHTVSMAWAVPVVEITLGSAEATGLGPTGRTVLAILRRGGVHAARGQATVGGRGGYSWSVTLRADSGAGSPVAIEPGDILDLVIASWQLTLTIDNLTVQAEPRASEVHGIAPAGREIEVTVTRLGARSQSVIVTADPDGTYKADFADRWEFSAGDSISASATLEGGHRLTALGAVPGLVVFLDTGLVQGSAVPGATVNLTLLDGGVAVASAETDAGRAGYFEAQLLSSAGDPLAPTEGQTLRMRFATTETTMVIPALTVGFDVEADTVSGTATPGGSVSIRAVPAFSGQGDARTATGQPDAGGNYALSFAGELDVRAGTLLEASYVLTEGHTARIDRHVPMVNVQLGGNLVNGHVAPAAAVTAVLNRGNAELSRVTADADVEGGFWASFLSDRLQPVKIEAGDVVVVTWQPGSSLLQQASGEIVVEVASLIATIDAATRTVSGTSAPNETVYLTMAVRGDAYHVAVTAEPDGSFSRSLGAAPPVGQPLSAQFEVETSVLAPSGHRTYVLLVVPYLELTMGSAEVRGVASPLTPLQLTLSEGGVTLGEASLTNTALGLFTAELVPSSASPAAIMAGRRMALDEPRSGTTLVEIPELTVELDAAAGVLRGRAPGTSLLLVRLYPAGLDAVTVQTLVGPTGNWSVGVDDLPPGCGFTIHDLRRADAMLTIGSGHLLIAITEPSVGPTPSPTPDGRQIRIYLPFSSRG